MGEEEGRSRLLQGPEVIEGIGTQRGAALRGVGIDSLARLLRTSADRIARAVPGTSTALVEKWQAAAHLLQVSDVEPDIAEALVDAGILSVKELADAGLRTLERAMERAVAEKRMRKAPSLYGLADLQRSAAKLADTGALDVVLVDRETRTPLQGITVRCAGRKEVTDEEGRLVLDALPVGLQSLELELGGGRIRTLRMPIRSRRVTNVREIRVARDGRARPTRREGAGKPLLFAAQCRFEFVERRLDELPDPTHLAVRKLDATGEAWLSHLYRSRVGRRIEVDRVKLPARDLPAGAAVGSVLELRDGALSTTPLSVKDVQRMKVEGVLRGTFREVSRGWIRPF